MELILSAVVDVGVVTTRRDMNDDDDVMRVTGVDALDKDAMDGFVTNPSTAAVSARNAVTATEFIVSLEKVTPCDEEEFAAVWREGRVACATQRHYNKPKIPFCHVLISSIIWIMRFSIIVLF